MSKEEKAKEYAHELWKGAWESDEYSIDTLETITEDTYVHGYEAAEQDLSSQLTACKEALRELVKDIEMGATAIVENNSRFYQATITPSVLTKAKTLIE